MKVHVTRFPSQMVSYFLEEDLSSSFNFLRLLEEDLFYVSWLRPLVNLTLRKLPLQTYQLLRSNTHEGTQLYNSHYHYHHHHHHHHLKMNSTLDNWDPANATTGDNFKDALTAFFKVITDERVPGNVQESKILNIQWKHIKTSEGCLIDPQEFIKRINALTGIP